MAGVAERLTAHAYLAREDPRRTELIDGMVVLTEPAVLHQQVCGSIFRALADWTDLPQGRGAVSLPLNVVLDERNVLAPDVLWFDGELPLDAVNAPRVPDLVVEVRSPGTWRYDVGRARLAASPVDEHGAAGGVGKPQLTHPVTLVELALGFDDALELAAEERLESPLLPGLSLRVRDLLPAA